MSAIRIVSAGDSTLIVELENRIDAAVNARVIQLANALDAAALAGVRDIVPTYRSVAIFFEPLRTDRARLIGRIEAEARWLRDVTEITGAPIRVPVCYGGDYGPDLSSVAAGAGMAPDEVVALHTAAIYRVFMLGFLPGFAYMGSVDERIAAARHASPRLRVPKGSVGIAGRQTGIYPSDSPGGWQLIGRTPLDLFDITRPAPSLFKAGDAVQCVAIDSDEFDRLSVAQQCDQAGDRIPWPSSSSSHLGC